MELPKLTPGKRFSLPRPVGSADSLLLAQLAERDKAAGRTTAIVTADATDAQRGVLRIQPVSTAGCDPCRTPPLQDSVAISTD